MENKRGLLLALAILMVAIIVVVIASPKAGSVAGNENRSQEESTLYYEDAFSLSDFETIVVGQSTYEDLYNLVRDKGDRSVTPDVFMRSYGLTDGRYICFISEDDSLISEIDIRNDNPYELWQMIYGGVDERELLEFEVLTNYVVDENTGEFVYNISQFDGVVKGKTYYELLRDVGEPSSNLSSSSTGFACYYTLDDGRFALIKIDAYVSPIEVCSIEIVDKRPFDR